MYNYGARSMTVFAELHEKLQRIAKYVIQIFDISLIEGYRPEDEQNEEFNEGTSKLKWPDSKHNHKPARALDAWPFPVSWPNIKMIPIEHRQAAREYAKNLCMWYYMGGLFKGIAVVLGIKIKWGGHFKSMFDGPHVELDDNEQ